MVATVTRLSRYPIKGLSPEPLSSVTLYPGNGFPGDRAFALALPSTKFDEDQPTPLPKTMFLMLARQEALARLRTSYNESTGILSMKDGTHVLSENIRNSDGRAAIERFFSGFLPANEVGQARLVTAKAHSFTDVGARSPELMRAVSMINLASVRDFESKLGEQVDPRRFRANILVDGLPPWVELDWVGRKLAIGSIKFEGARLTVRCPATEVNPDTAVRDIRLPYELKRIYGHIHLGLYLYVESEGALSVGDEFVRPSEH